MKIDEVFWKRAVVAVPLIALALFLFHLSARPFVDYDEAIYANVLHDTSVSGNFIQIQSGSGPFFDKPPLYFWLALASSKIIPSPEFAYRFPSALAAFLCIVLVMAIVREVTKQDRFAALAGFALLTIPLFFDVARQVRIDILLSSGILLAFYTFLRGLRQPAWLLGIGVGIAIAVLTKNVIGFLAIPIILIWAVAQKEYRWLKSPYFWGSALLGIALLLPWHLAQTLTYGSTFWSTYLGFNVLDRFASNVNGGVGRGAWFYVPYLAVYAFPWIWIASILGVIAVWVRKDLRSGRAAVLASAAQVVFLGGIFFFASTKLPHYLIPALTFVPVFIAISAWCLYEEFPRRRTLLTNTLLFAALLGVLSTAYIGMHANRELWISDTLASNERDIGVLIHSRADGLPLYMYQYPYLDTIHYYSGQKSEEMKIDMVLDRPFYLVLRSELYARHPFPESLNAHFSSLYSGEAVTLLMFNP